MFLFLSNDTQGTKRLTKRAPDAGESGAIPSLFLRLIFFPVGRRPAARPSAGNANRWAFPRKYICTSLVQNCNRKIECLKDKDIGMLNLVSSLVDLVVGVIGGVIVLFIEYMLFNKHKSESSNSKIHPSQLLDDTKPRYPKVFPAKKESFMVLPKSEEKHIGFADYIYRQFKLIWFLFLDEKTPLKLKLLPIIAVIYCISPVDIVGIPVLGYIDDLTILTIFLWWFLEYSPAELKNEYIKKLGL